MNAPTRYRIAIVAPFPHPHIPHEGWMTRISSVDNQLEGIPRIYLNYAEHHDDSQCDVLERDAERAEALLNTSGTNSAEFVSALVERVDAIYVHTLHLAEHIVPWLNTSRVFVDIHGITPEEEEMMGHPRTPGAVRGGRAGST